MANSITRKRVASASLLEYASKNKNEGFFNDIIIVAGDEEIPSNRLVLSCYSPYFEGLFKMMKKERKFESFIEINNVDGKTINTLIDFIYEGSITITNQNVMSLLSGANYFRMEEIKQFCFEFLRSNISPQNSLSIFRAATLYNNNALKEEAQLYISDNFDQVHQTDDFKTVSKDDLVSVISNSNRKQVQSTSIYHSIITWASHEEDRKPEVFNLLKLIKFEDFTMEFLENVVLKEQLVQTSHNCQVLALNSLLQKKNEKIEESRTQLSTGAEETETNLKHRKEVSKLKIVSLGGAFTRNMVKVVYCLQSKTQIITFPTLPQPFSPHGSLLFETFIYSIGVEDRDKTAGKVWSLNYAQQNAVWKPVPSTNKKRKYLACAVFNNAVVVVGGLRDSWLKSDNLSVATSEYLGLHSNKWKYFASLNKARSHHALVQLNGYLYALGGWNEKDGRLSSVERLSALTATSWENVASMQTPKGWFAAVCCRGEIYAIGGQSNSRVLKSVEKYDAATSRWKYVSDMNIERYRHSACVLQDKIYVVGGRDKEYEAVKKIECYDSTNNTWKVVGEVSDELWGHSLIVL